MRDLKPHLMEDRYDSSDCGGRSRVRFPRETPNGIARCAPTARADGQGALGVGATGSYTTDEGCSRRPARDGGHRRREDDGGWCCRVLRIDRPIAQEPARIQVATS